MSRSATQVPTLGLAMFRHTNARESAANARAATSAAAAALAVSLAPRFMAASARLSTSGVLNDGALLLTSLAVQSASRSASSHHAHAAIVSRSASLSPTQWPACATASMAPKSVSRALSRTAALAAPPHARRTGGTSRSHAQRKSPSHTASLSPKRPRHVLSTERTSPGRSLNRTPAAAWPAVSSPIFLATSVAHSLTASSTAGASTCCGSRSSEDCSSF
mmetsp:Transcript_7120/g.21491  ORF Transcript_7120/g.21491 Transcript_7120/m.21491 type:complete len:220 (+) Transcript_7120:1714-2373(+)